MYYMINHETNQVTEFDVDTSELDSALRIMKKMRWVKVKRYGRRGKRSFIITMRNRDEWKHGHIMVNGIIKATIK